MMQLKPGQGGLQVVGWLGAGIEEIAACNGAAAQGINSVPLSKLTIDRTLPPALVLGVASADVGAIRQAVTRLGKVLRPLQQPGRALS
jgi:GntR family transcriptional regulator/MocR family aminotransferase